MIETTADRKEYDFHRVLEYYPECSFDSFTIKEYSILFEHGPEISYLDFHQYIQCKMIRYERELMHAQIIRDADKLDNCRVKLETAIETLLGVAAEQVGMSEITPEVMQQFKNHKSVLLETRKTKMDYWISYLAYFYDINFKATYESIRDNHYVDKIIGRIPYTNPDTGKQMEQIRNEMNLYIQNAIKENGNYK